ncbi:hypothetical protein C8Q70DRAFT_1014320 [Cubamyces menziesii]|nr:hypothetical protein C8Q70DRAFT_1014320 [Cubamyces menziesii]
MITSPSSQQTQLDDMIREREEELRGLYALKNASTPINRLPVEILAEIFLHVAQHARISAPGWHRILCVCRHWFVVGATMPRLWTRILCAGCTNQLRTSLARSKSIPVDIELTSATPSRGFTITEVIPIIAPHVHRLQSIRFGVVPSSDAPEVLAFLQNHSFPALQTLQALPRSNAGRLEVDLDRFPRLCELRFANLDAFPSTAIMSQLTTLELTAYGEEGPSLAMDELLTALQSLSNIEDLTLTDVNVRNTATPLLRGASKIELKKLRKIAITMDAVPMKRILSEIAIPPSATVYLSPECVENLPPGSFYELLDHSTKSLPLLKKLTVVHICATSWEVSIKGSTALSDHSLFKTSHPRCPFELSVDPEPLTDEDRVTVDLDDALRAVESMPEVQVLDIHVSPEMSIGVHWADSLLALYKLQELTVTMSVEPDSNAIGAHSLELLFKELTELPPFWKEFIAPEESMICTDLRHLRLVGLWNRPVGVARRIAQCLRERRRVLGREVALEELTINLDYNIMPYEDFLDFKRVFEEAVGPLVGKLVFEMSYVDPEDW